MSTTATSGSACPVQILRWSEKTEDWFKQNIEYRISRAGFTAVPDPTGSFQDLDVLYNAYNNRFPLKWFDHITNPLSASKEAHKKFPAKIRPVGILRTNIDLLLGEFPRRPFIYNVSNLGDTGYNRRKEAMKQAALTNLTQQFKVAALQEAQSQGMALTPEEQQQLEQAPPLPEQVKAEFQGSFLDIKAVKAQKWLKRTIRDLEIKQKLHRQFKHWLITGQCVTYKGIENEQLVYRELSPKYVSFEMSESCIFGEDGEGVVAVEWLMLSEIVDRHYRDLKEDDLKKLELGGHTRTPMGFFSHLAGIGADQAGRYPLYHVQWKGKKLVKILHYPDPDTFEPQEMEVDEDYVADETAGETIEEIWINEVYEGWRITDDIYIKMQPVPVQRNEMNNLSTCKLSYNKRNFSDLHSENISVMEIGLPFQILYIIVGYTIEKTIAKSKGKILLIDKGAIPKDGNWDDEKFFYYSEALGYALLNRNQMGVDKSWNQYQVVDMSLFDSIKQLIEIQQHLKQEWDDIIGITRQRKGQTYASDLVGVNERATFQSTVITDMIFLGFEEFEERELQGLLDLAKFVTAKGLYGTYNSDVTTTELLEIDPDDFMNEELGVYIERSSEEIRKLETMRGQVQAMLQNDHKASTILEIIDAVNISELRIKLQQIEELDAQIQSQQADTEHERAMALEKSRKDFLSFQELLKRGTQQEKYDREEDLLTLQMALQHDQEQPQPADDGQAAANDAQKLQQNSLKVQEDIRDKREKRLLESRKQELAEQQFDADQQQRKIDNQHTKQDLKIKSKKAAQRPKASKK